LGKRSDESEEEESRFDDIDKAFDTVERDLSMETEGSKDKAI